MNIFNSLGSNYNFGFVLKSIFSKKNQKKQEELKRFLEEKYSGEVHLTYKGREALRLALCAADLKGATVGVCGFTCFAVYEAIVKEGYDIEYLDIEKKSLNFSANTLEKHIEKNKNLKIVFMQNSLGYPGDIENISMVCKKFNIILLEDLAHSVGAKYENGKEAGTVGDMVMLSFSQDKIIDSVSGGALIIRNKRLKNVNGDVLKIKNAQILKDRFYPAITFKIRFLYGLFIGKILHKIFKSAKLLSMPMNYLDSDNIHSLPSEYCDRIYSQFILLDRNIDHRRRIAKIYKDNIKKQILSDEICRLIDTSSNLRFPIFVEKRSSLIGYLKNEGIYLSDIWYDAPVAPRKYLNKTSYKNGDCPNSEIVTEQILNLPTHRNVSEKKAEIISRKINIWLQSQ